MRRTTTTDSDRLVLAGKRVLIVDDDDDSRDLLRAVLESRDMEVSDSDSVDAALATLDRGQFNLIISDIGMPARDGYSLIRAVRSRSESLCVPAVALTAFGSAEDRTRAEVAGFDLHFGKPFDQQALVRALVALLGQPKCSA